MLDYSDLQKGTYIVLENQPYEVLETKHLSKGRGSAVLQTKIKNLVTGNILERNFHPGESFEEAEILKVPVKFIYSHRGKFVFSKKDNPAQRFEIEEKIIGPAGKFIKPNQELEAIEFQGKIINVIVPIKVHLKVIEAPPGLQGGREQAGTKTVTLETGAKINVPLFIEEGDIIEINTESQEYVKRVNLS